MYDQVYDPLEVPQGQEIKLRMLEPAEISEVSGGFVCGGLCLAGLAFGAGALFGSGVAIGYHNAN